jgi:flagellar motor switch protein FliM
MPGSATGQDARVRECAPAPTPHARFPPVDVLAVTPTSTAQARRKRSAEPEPYDFRRPMTLAREHARALELAFETFSRQWGILLTTRTRVVAQVALEAVELTSYDEYVRPMPQTSLMILCAMEPGHATAVLQMPVEAGMIWIDYVLGGPGVPLDVPDRELTEIEWHLLRDLVQHSLNELKYAFASVLPLELTARSVQYAPQSVQAAAASTPVVVATFSVELGHRTEPATLMMPAELLLASMHEGDDNDKRSAEEVRAHLVALNALSTRVRDVPVEVSVRFRPLTVTPPDVGELAVGDVVGLRHRADAPLDVVVGDVVLAKAALGSNGNRLACLVVSSEEKHS